MKTKELLNTLYIGAIAFSVYVLYGVVMNYQALPPYPSSDITPFPWVQFLIFVTFIAIASFGLGRNSRSKKK